MPAASSPLRAEVRILREQVEHVLRDFFGPDELEWSDQLHIRVRIALNEMYRQRGEWRDKCMRAVIKVREAEQRINDLVLDLDTSVGASLRPTQDDPTEVDGCRTAQHDAADAAVNLLSAAVPAASAKPGNAPIPNAATPTTAATEPTTATGSARLSSNETCGASAASTAPPSPTTTHGPAGS